MYRVFFKSGTTSSATTVRGVGHTLGFILFFCALPVWAGTADFALSEQKAIDLGLNRPEIIQQLEASAELAESDIVEARTWENPEFSFDQESSDNVFLDSTERTYMLSQKFDISGRRAIQTQAARQRFNAVGQENLQWQLERTADIRQKFYAVLYQQQLHDIFLKWSSGMDAMKIVMHKRKEAGDISGYDLDRLRHEQSFVQARQQQAHAEHERLTRELLAAIGLVGEPTLSGVKGHLLPETPPMSLETLLVKMEEHPELMSMDLQSQAYATDERFSKRWWLSDFTIGVGVKDVQDDDTLLFNLSMPIPVFDRSSAAQQRAKASRRQMQNKYKLALSEKEGMIRGLWHQAMELAGAVRSMTSEESCLALVHTAEVAYQAGEIGVLEIIDAYRTSFENRSQILSLMLESRMVRIELDLITGGNT